MKDYKSLTVKGKKYYEAHVKLQALIDTGVRYQIQFNLRQNNEKGVLVECQLRLWEVVHLDPEKPIVNDEFNVIMHNSFAWEPQAYKAVEKAQTHALRRVCGMAGILIEDSIGAPEAEPKEIQF